MRSTIIACIALLVAALCGCGMSKVNSVAIADGPKPATRTIAIMPGGGVLADAVAVELLNRGFTVIDANATSSMMVRLNLNEIEITRPEGLAKIRDQGIEAVLIVRAVGGYDQQPQSATARMTSTTDGRVLAGVTWQNGFGGQAGSMADRVMRQGLTGAATEIADNLATRVQ